MNGFDIDDVDKGVLYYLQQNARHNTTASIGAEIGVSGTTVGNRIRQMEDRGIIEGYQPEINYEKVGLHLHLLYICSVPVEDREELAREAMGVNGVVAAQEIHTGDENLLVEAVFTKPSEISATTETLEKIGIETRETEILGKRHFRPFNHFGQGVEKEDR
jgi:DNA-binding Lrp family transcriptional regulator